jgi:hypothetical protein
MGALPVSSEAAAAVVGTEAAAAAVVGTEAAAAAVVGTEAAVDDFCSIIKSDWINDL